MFVGVTVGELVGVAVGVVVGVSVIVGVDVGDGVFVGVSVVVGVSVGVSVGVGVNATQVPLGPSHPAFGTRVPGSQLPPCWKLAQFGPLYWQQSARARLAAIEKTNATSIGPNTHLHPEPIMAVPRSRSGLRCCLCPTCVDPFVDLKQPL